MDDVIVKRMDHLGLVAGVVKDLGVIEQIDAHLPGEQKVSTGQAIVSMVLNGLGFTDRPLSLTAEFFKEISVPRLLGADVTYEDLNRHRLGRCLDEVAEYGVSRLFSQIASHVVVLEKVSTQTRVLDTTSFSVTGRKYEDTDENEITITHGFSKDHRPDLMQVVSELVVSTDGGVPLMLMNHDGNSNDSKIFRERSEKLADELSGCDGRLIADSKLYCQENIKNLEKFTFVTRIPETNKEAKALINQAVDKEDGWQSLDETHFFQTSTVTHFGLKQNWIVFYSTESLSRCSKTINKKVAKEKSEIEKQIYHFHASAFGCQDDAQKAADKITKNWKYHAVDSSKTNQIDHFEGVGRPKKDAVPTSRTYSMTISFSEKTEVNKKLSRIKACFILGTNDLNVLPNELLNEYKSQGSVERGFRFLKNPSFFTSSFFLKKPSRINALIGIMAIALLIYSIAERRLRASIRESEEPFVDPVYGKTSKPTLKRVMQLMLNINEVWTSYDGVSRNVITGITDFRRQIIEMISVSALQIYSIN